MNACRRLAAAALVALLTACASTPRDGSGPHEETLSLRAWEGPEYPGARGGPELAGVRCTLSNDKGSWTAITPGRVTVLPSTAALDVECTLDGYKAMSASFRCRSLREVERRRVASVLLVPFLVLAPHIVAPAMARASDQATPADLEPERRFDGGYPCTYGNIAASMSRQ